MLTHTSSRPAKVLHIVGDSKFGGGSVIVLRLAEMARRMGCEVDVLTTDHVFQEALAAQGIGFVNLDVSWRDIRLARDLRGLFKLRQFLRHSDYSFVHTHTSKAGVVGRIAARLAGIPHIVHTVHGFAFHEESSRRALLAYSTIERMAAFFCHRIVTVSEFHRGWALKLRIGSKGKVVAIPNGLDALRVQSTKSREEIRMELNLNPNTFMVLTTGRLAEQKGLEHLLGAIAEVKQRLQSPFKLILAGTGPLQERLEQLISELSIADCVQFLGFRRDISDLLAASDVVVLPSLREGLSIALLEAMAAGKPIITTTIGSNIEATRNGIAAKLVAPKDSRALADAILEFAGNRELAATKGQAAQQAFNDFYTEERMLDGYRGLYQQLMRNASLPALADETALQA